MTLNARDASIVQLVARFKQVSSRQVRELLFHELSTNTPCERRLRRLVADQYLIRIERRMVGGPKGGSGQYVYALGRRGYYLYFEGKYNPARSINYHSLAITDCFLHLKRQERLGALDILGYSTEPESWASIDHVDLRPDFSIDVIVGGVRQPRIWCEVDLGTEGQKQLRRKLEDYWLAYQLYLTADGLPPFPRIVWVAIDQERVKEIRWLLGEGAPSAQALFRVCTIDQLEAHVA